MKEKFAVLGGAGFIGSHFVCNLLEHGHETIVVDNFCSGTMEHLGEFIKHPLLTISELNIEDTDNLTSAIKGVDTIIHLASNPDIARAAIEPRIDFTQGTMLTESVVEAARLSRVSNILYASGSGVYGDAGEMNLTENSPLAPINTYGASKLAGESLIAAYSFMFGIKAKIFRFANVVGPRQTHGVGYDFLRKLKNDPSHLVILGDGSQSKSYVYVEDVVSGVLHVHHTQGSNTEAFNISTEGYLTVRDIALMAIETMGISQEMISLEFGSENRGWKGDVPVVRLDYGKITSTAWLPTKSSKEAMAHSLVEIRRELMSIL